MIARIVKTALAWSRPTCSATSRVVDDLIHRQHQEVVPGVHQQGMEAAEGRADRDAGQRRLGERGLEHALAPELARRAQRRAERFPFHIVRRHAQDEDPVVLRHRLASASSIASRT